MTISCARPVNLPIADNAALVSEALIALIEREGCKKVGRFARNDARSEKRSAPQADSRFLVAALLGMTKSRKS